VSVEPLSWLFNTPAKASKTHHTCALLVWVSASAARTRRHNESHKTMNTRAAILSEPSPRSFFSISHFAFRISHVPNRPIPPPCKTIPPNSRCDSTNSANSAKNFLPLHTWTVGLRTCPSSISHETFHLLPFTRRENFAPFSHFALTLPPPSTSLRHNPTKIPAQFHQIRQSRQKIKTANQVRAARLPPFARWFDTPFRA
jgi:hypothetical protein